ncbi:MAG: IS1/IS6 family transposase, partial [Methanomicrobia archaeon]|nr:IS1/IS6 family transposase [Methanomicrobia archaeon]
YPTTENRKVRGYSILAKGVTPIVLEKDRKYKIPSQSNHGFYIVTRGYKVYTCTCLDHQYRKVECKHINAVKFWLKLKDKLKEETTFTTDIKISNEIKCPSCSSTNIVKRGIRKTKNGIKQRYQCKDCKKKFSVQDGFKYMKNDSKIITLALDLYFKGVSQNAITEHLRQFYDVSVSQPSISRWIRKYTRIISEYVRTLTPDVSGMWAVDEMALKCKGEWNWLWNLIDTESRFLISSMISEGKVRDVDIARRPFREAKKLTKKKPDIIVSDGLQAYKKAVKKEFQANKKYGISRTLHIREIAITNEERNNNKIERLNGTVRQRNKVQRGLKEIPSSRIFIEGFKNYYNFIRPHMSLNGKTPAEVVGLNLNLEGNKWMDIIKESVENKN